MNCKFREGDILRCKDSMTIKIMIVGMHRTMEYYQYSYIDGSQDASNICCGSVDYIDQEYEVDKSSKLKGMIDEL